MFTPRLLCAAFLAIPGLTAMGQLKDDAPPDAKALDIQIKAFAEARQKKKTEFLEWARGEIAKPIQSPGSAGNYVIESMRVVQYEGKDGGNGEFVEWKKKNRGMFSDRDFERASELYLRYLSLTLRRANLKSAEPLQGEIWSYLTTLNESKDLLANAGHGNQFARDLLNQGVASGVVAQALKLSNHLGQIPNWAMVPGDFSAIMEQDLRTVMREKKDPKLLSTWDSEVAFLAAVAELKKDRKEQEKFRLETYPKLMWKKAADAELLGLQNRALNIRLDTARKYPEHQDFETWAKQIEDQLGRLKEAKEAPVEKPDDAVAPIQPVPAGELPAPTPS